jgi:hypothetical protein
MRARRAYRVGRDLSRLAAVAAVLVFIPAAAAHAATRPPLGVPGYLTDGPAVGTHFVVHYTSSSSHPADQVSSADAGTLLADAETAYSYYVGQWGYPPPRDDGDGKTDVYVFHIPVGPVAGPDSTTSDQTSGYVIIDPAAVNQYAIAHEFFHVIQFGIYQHGGFISESSAEWAGQAVVAATGGSPPPNWYPDPQTSLDCLGSSCGDAPGGYRGSIFWEFLSERFGMGFVRDVYDRDAALAAAAGDHQPHDLQALSDALAARGSSLADAFNGYAVAAVAGQITRPGVLPNVPVADAQFYASLPITYVPRTFTVNHLALARIGYLGGDASDHVCDAATLHIQVDMPAGIASRPFFVTYPASGQPPATAVYSLAIVGNTATADVPWQRCASSNGSLTLPNASSSSDGQMFVVHVSVIPPPPPAHPAPTLSKLRVAPARFILAGRRVGRRCVPMKRAGAGIHTCTRPIALIVSYQLTIPASVTFTFERVLDGRVTHGRCATPTRANRTARRCSRLIGLPGAITRSATAGANSVTFSGRIGRRVLSAGTYRLTATPTAAGITGNRQAVSFELVRVY